MLSFSDNDQKWQPVPIWVEFLIQLGYRWRSAAFGGRIIAVISMPCDSAAAGLIALGALIRDLHNPGANDLDGHYNALLRYAHQYLESCRQCTLRCRPEEKGCGYSAEATGWVRNWKQEQPKRYKISEKTNLAEKQLIYAINNGTWWQTPRDSTNWQIDGEPALQLPDNDVALDKGIYDRITDGNLIAPENLRRSYSGLCLAGRVTGKAASHAAFECAHLRDGNRAYCLTGLLTIHEWSQGSVSRMSFYNPRTEHFDHYTSTPSLTIVDGDKTFLKILGRPEFQRSDIVAVIHRVMEREDLEALGNRIQSLRQWYRDDPEVLRGLPSIPQGISVTVVTRRSD